MTRYSFAQATSVVWMAAAVALGSGCGAAPDDADVGDVSEAALGEAGQEASAVKCFPPPGGLAEWWTFDEASGPTADDIGGTFNDVGTHVNGPGVIAGMVGNALSFDGVNDFVLVPSALENNFYGSAPGPAQDFTIDAWVRIDSSAVAGVRVILDKRVNPSQPRGYSLYTSNGYLGFQMADAAVPGGVCGSGSGFACTNWVAPSGYLGDGNWHLVAVTVDRSPSASPVGTMYVDGASVYTFSPRTGSLLNSAPLQIGRRLPAFGASYFTGDIDEVEIFKKALPSHAIASIYAAGAAGKCKSSCSDGVQNGSETGVDCGGSCPPCCVATQEVCNGLDDDCDGVVDNGGNTLCDDGDSCSGDTCGGALGCLYTSLVDGTPCGKAGACGTPVCQQGACATPTPSTTPWNVQAQGMLGFTLVGYMAQIEAAGSDTVVAGLNCDSWDIGLGPSLTGSSIPPSNGTSIRCEVLVSKVDDSGTALWMTRPSHGYYFAYAPSLDVDAGGNTYVMVTPYDYYGYDARGYINKLDSSGVEQWSLNLSPGAGDYFESGGGTVLVANNGDILVSYHMADGVTFVTSHYVARYTSAGTLVWQSSVSPVVLENPSRPPHGLVEDSSGNIYAVGTAQGTLVVGSSTITGSAPYIAKFSSTGTPLSAVALPTAMKVFELRKDSVDNIYLAGQFSGTITLGSSLVSAGSTDIVLASFDTNLALLGAARFGGAGGDTPTGFAIDGSDVLHVFGAYDSAGTGSAGISFGGPTLGAVQAPTGYVYAHFPTPMFLAQLTTSFAHVSTRGFDKGSPADLDVDCTGQELLSGKTQELQAIDLGIDPPPHVVAFGTRLGPPADACGAGSCSGGSFVDGCTAYSPTTNLSLAACACGLVNPACGAGSCYAGQYCSGDACGPSVCYPTTDPRSLTLCNGGTLSGSCVASGGTKVIFQTNAGYSGNVGGPSGGDAICQAAAVAAGLSGTYKTFLGDSSTDLFYHALSGFEGALVGVDGSVVYPTETALGPQSYVVASNPFETEFDTTPPIANAWVGPGCTDWTNGASGTGVYISSSLWATGGVASCTTTNSLVCLEQ